MTLKDRVRWRLVTRLARWLPWYARISYAQFGEDVAGLLSAGGIAISGGPGRYLALAAAFVSLLVAGLDLRRRS